MEVYPQRKTTKLKDYDYSQNGYYFITICTINRINYFGEVRRGGVLLLPNMALTEMGKIVSDQWHEIQSRYENIILDEFIVMPNHIHGIIAIADRREEQSPSPTINDIVCAFKSITTKICNKSGNSQGRIIWQRSFHDNIIRNEQSLMEIREYIVNNASKWQDDKYYQENHFDLKL